MKRQTRKTLAKPSHTPRKRRKQGSLKEARLLLWAAIERVSGLIADDETMPETAIKACNGLGQLTMAYARLVESLQAEPANELIYKGMYNQLQEQAASDHFPDVGKN
jgi:hypothetical protein